MSKQFESQDFAMYENTALTDAVLKLAEENLGETNEIRTESLQILKWKIAETKNFHPRMDDIFLLKFLRIAKFDVIKAFDRLKNYYKQRLKYPEIYESLYPSAHRNFFSSHQSHFVLPHRNTDNTSIFVCNKRMGATHPVWDNVIKDIQLDLMFFEALLDEAVDQIGGITSIVDLREHQFSDCLKVLIPRNIRVYTSNVLNVLAGRLRGLHFVNAPKAANLLYNIVYPFLPQKIRSKIIIHPSNDNWKSLHSHIPPEVLPEEFGGKQGPMDFSFFLRILESKDTQFRENLKYGYRTSENI